MNPVFDFAKSVTSKKFLIVKKNCGATAISFALQIGQEAKL